MKNLAHKLIIITAPSGSGKSSIIFYLLNHHPLLNLSISAATRKPRAGEKNGVEYYFLTETDFKTKIEANEFVEWEMVYQGSYYGTLRTELERIWNLGKTPILDIDVKGGIHLKQEFGMNCLSIFIEPPSIEALKNRLINRGTETPESIINRVSKASYEMSFRNHFHKTILNKDLATACSETEKLIKEFLGW